MALELARIVYHVLVKQEAFNGQFKGRVLSHQKHALGSPRSEATGRAQLLRVGEPIMVLGRHRV